MERNEHFILLEDTGLEETDIFTRTELDRFREWGITTIGNLLGATSGLKRRGLFLEMGVSATSIELISRMVPETLLERFREPNADMPLGLLSEEDTDEA